MWGNKVAKIGTAWKRDVHKLCLTIWKQLQSGLCFTVCFGGGVVVICFWVGFYFLNITIFEVWILFCIYFFFFTQFHYMLKEWSTSTMQTKRAGSRRQDTESLGVPAICCVVLWWIIGSVRLEDISGSLQAYLLFQVQSALRHSLWGLLESSKPAASSIRLLVTETLQELLLVICCIQDWPNRVQLDMGTNSSLHGFSGHCHAMCKEHLI